LSLRLQAMPAADFASEGQQRTISLALKLAQGALLEQCTRRVPIYLLDDIFGELDPSRRNALMAHLPRTAQKWITTTRIDWLNQQGDLGNLTRFTVRNGTCG
jgi:DNA replication and repair protein RecF